MTRIFTRAEGVGLAGLHLLLDCGHFVGSAVCRITGAARWQRREEGSPLVGARVAWKSVGQLFSQPFRFFFALREVLASSHVLGSKIICLGLEKRWTQPSEAARGRSAVASMQGQP